VHTASAQVEHIILILLVNHATYVQSHRSMYNVSLLMIYVSICGVYVHILSIRYRYQAITGAAGSGSDVYTYIPPTIRYMHTQYIYKYTDIISSSNC
jgi:hypothetical protein